MDQATVIAPAPGVRPRRALLSRRRLILATGALVGSTTGLVGLRHLRAVADPSPTATLQLSSEPAGATVRVDGHTRGRTPLVLPVAVGPHRVVFQHPRAIETSVTVKADAQHTVRLGTEFWRSLPTAQPLRPPFPGTVIAGADFLANGDFALLARPQTGGGFSLWHCRDNGSLQRLGPASAAGRILPRPDGQTVAFLAPDAPAASDPAGAAPATTVWTAADDGRDAARRYTLPATRRGEELADLSWAPDGAHLLAVAHRAESGGARDRLLRLDLHSGTAEPVTELPTAIVPGSLTWAPGGTRVTLLTQTGTLVSLCLVDAHTGAVRYLADLGRRDPAALPYPPIAWSPNGHQLVYAAGAHQRATGLGGLLLGEQTVDLLSLADAEAGQGRPLDPAPALAPVWRDGGDILALARGSGGQLTLDRFTPPRGRVPAVGTLPVTPASPVAVRWDAAHARALLVQHGDAGLTGWLLSFTIGGR